MIIVFNRKQKKETCLSPFLVVALPGLEPGNAAPKTVVLPLHYKAILVSTGRQAAQIAVQNYCFFLNFKPFVAKNYNKNIKSLDNQQIIVLLTLLGQDVLAVEQHVGTGSHVGVGELLLVDAHATALGQLAHLALAGEYGSHLGQQ